MHREGLVGEKPWWIGMIETTFAICLKIGHMKIQAIEYKEA